MIARLGSLAFLLLVSENRARLAEIEIAGPVRDLALWLGAAGETRLAGELLSGERVRLVVPLPVREPAGSLRPELRWEGSDSLDSPGESRGSARFLGWSPDLAAAELERLPPGVRARSRPPVEPPEIRAPWAALAVLPACFVLGIALRRRRVASLALAIAGSGLVLGLAWPRVARAPRNVTVLESDAESPLGLEVRATWEQIEVGAADLERAVLEVLPAEARILWTGSLPRDAAWRASSSGSALFLLRPFERSEHACIREENRSRPLAETWVREDGEWTARGPWSVGVPLPPPEEGPPPPGWLVAGLPQGVPVLLGRARAEAPGEVVWIRATGF